MHILLLVILLIAVSSKMGGGIVRGVITLIFAGLLILIGSAIV